MRGTKHGKPFGIHARGWFCALALGGFSITSYAGYAQVQPPSGWSPGVSGGFPTYSKAANEQWLSSTVRTNGSLAVPGRTVQVPASMRLAANAPRFAARFLFTNPAVALASTLLIGWVGTAGFSWDESTSKWVKQTPGGNQPGVEYAVSGAPGNDWFPSKQAACNYYAAYRGVPTAVYTPEDNFCRIYRSNGSYLDGLSFWSRDATVYVPPTKVPVTPEEFEEQLAPKPLPEQAPNIIPMPWPVELPRLNPDATPSANPQPMRIPTGDPYQVPNTDPAQYRRPALDIVPSPTPSSPWRVDLQPKDIPVPDMVPRPLPPPVPLPTPPVPIPDPDLEVDPNLAPEPGKDPQESEDFCAKNPDVLACQKPDLDTPEQEIPRRNFAVTFAAETLFGNGSCPANKTMNLRGQQITVWDFQKTCNLVETYLKPLLITLALFSAFIILSPGKDA